MKSNVNTPLVIGVIAVAVVLVGFIIYRSQPHYDPPTPMQIAPPPMPPLVQGADGRMRAAPTPTP